MDTERKAPISGLELSNTSFPFLKPAARPPRLAITIDKYRPDDYRNRKSEQLFPCGFRGDDGELCTDFATLLQPDHHFIDVRNQFDE